MKSQVAESLLAEIDTAIENIGSFGIINDLEKSYLAKFLIVYISGIYEEAIENILGEWAARRCAPELAQFICDYLDHNFRNPDVEEIVGLLSQFKEEWGEEISNLPNVNTSAIDTIVANKNAIAHGTPCIMTLEQVEEYYNRSRPVIEKIDDIVL